MLRSRILITMTLLCLKPAYSLRQSLLFRQRQVQTSFAHRCVHLSGRTALHSSFRASSSTKALVRPPNPRDLLSPQQIQENADQLAEWIQMYENILVITGAGLSTESGIPDYRGHTGSYHEGHKPVLHDQFLSSEAHRRRYWGRSMVRRIVDSLLYCWIPSSTHGFVSFVLDSSDGTNSFNDSPIRVTLPYQR